MPITKYTASTAIIAALSDLPNATDGLTAAQLKAKFDENPEAFKVFVNKLIDQLESTADTTSGAHQIGSAPITGVTGTNVQDKLAALKTLFDGYVIDQIPDGSLTDPKLSNDPADIKARFTDFLGNANAQTSVIPHGLSVIETDQKTPLDIAMDGRTLVNPMGWQGKFESLFNRWNANLAIDTSVSKFGTSSGKIDNSAGTTTKSSQNSQKQYLSGKYILLGVWAKAVSGTPKINVFQFGYDSAGTRTTIAGTGEKIIDATWEFYYMK
jgi:hypothetical protein